MTLDPELVISKGRATLSHKQKLIDDVLEQSYEISLGGGSFGYCLVCSMLSSSLIMLAVPRIISFIKRDSFNKWKYNLGINLGLDGDFFFFFGLVS